MFVSTYNAPCGALFLAEINHKLAVCDWSTRYIPTNAIDHVTPLLHQAISQLDEYFQDLRSQFSIPLLPQGSDFALNVWAKLLNIPYGHTASYAQIARQIGRPTATRAVARAIAANPLSIFIPCHRVIGSNGALTGYAGSLPAKFHLLHLESPTTPL